MNHAVVTTGHLENGRNIILDEKIVEGFNKVRVIIEAIETKRVTRKPGIMKGKIKLAPDFDEPLEDFKEYIE